MHQYSYGSGHAHVGPGEGSPTRPEPGPRANVVEWRGEANARDVPQVARELERIREVSTVYLKLVEELKLRLDPVIMPAPRVTGGEAPNGHTEAPLAPLALALRESAQRIEAGNASMQDLLRALGI
jgi:hypothetical protein